MNGKDLKLATIRLRYLVDLAQQVIAFDAWLEAGDFTVVAKNAHRIKGTAGTYQLDDIAAVMAAIEPLAASGDAAAIQDKLKEAAGLVEAQRQRAEQACRELMDKQAQERTDG
ncbi:MAG: Hpt domain-containing protein [Planctomycetota bacterium]